MPVSIAAPPAAVIPEDYAVPAEPIWRLTVAQYHEMIRGGILQEDDPVELLEGWLITKMSKNPPHRISTRRVRQRLSRVLPDGWYVDTQEPITTSDSEPESDVAVIRGESEHYADRHPGPGDVALVVEVADASLRRDRSIKLRAYARAGVPVYWIVNLARRTVEVYTTPSGPADQPDYRERSEYREGTLVPFVVDGRTSDHIPVDDLLPPAADQTSPSTPLLPM